MKLSLWQQFSSNHSTTYSLIGTFDTQEDAQRARDVFHQLISEIAALNAGTSAEERKALDERYAHLYGIEWDWTEIDWMGWFTTRQGPLQEQIDDHFALFDHHLIIDSDGDSSVRASDALIRLLKAMGAKVYARMNDDDLLFRLTCTAPDEEMARQIYDIIEAHLQRPFEERGSWIWRFTVPTAWALYHPRFQTLLPNLTPAQYEAALQAWHAWFETIFVEDITTSVTRLEREAPILNRMRTLWEETSLEEGELSRDGRRVVYEEKEGYIRALVILPALYDWLASMGCDVQYEFLEKSNE